MSSRAWLRSNRGLHAALTLTLAAPLGACSLLVDGAIHDPMRADTCQGLDDGTTCTREGITAPLICLADVCSSSRCGDGILDMRPKADSSIEECDDGNDVPGDGCEPDCTETVLCTDDGECPASEVACEVARCDTDSGECYFETDADGNACTVAGDSGVCASGECVAAGCGDGTLDSGEICDDGNTDPGDGCSAFCKPECSDDASCPQDVCLGHSRCEVSDGATGQLGVCLPDPSQATLSCATPCEICDSVAEACVPSPDADADFDGHASIACGGDDCDDTNAGINPGLPETCGDGVDVNCNGDADEGAVATWYADCDADNYAATGAESMMSCGAPMATPAGCDGGWTTRPPTRDLVDCFDSLATVRPYARDYSATPYVNGAGVSTFDYDCDGAETPEYPRVLSPNLAGCDASCRSTAPVVSLTATCGGAATLYECLLNTSGVCTRTASRARYYLACR